MSDGASLIRPCISHWYLVSYQIPAQPGEDVSDLKQQVCSVDYAPWLIFILILNGIQAPMIILIGDAV